MRPSPTSHGEPPTTGPRKGGRGATGTWWLVVAAMALAFLALAACGTGGETPNNSLPGTVTLPDRSTTVPETETTGLPIRPTAPDSTEPATTRPPIAAAPTTRAPITAAPTTRPPVTAAPTTATPATAAPATAAPTTAAVAATTTTESPATTTSTTTEAPTTTVAGPQEPADDSTTWWPWLLAGLAVAGLVTFFMIRRSRQAASGSG